MGEGFNECYSMPCLSISTTHTTGSGGIMHVLQASTMHAYTKGKAWDNRGTCLSVRCVCVSLSVRTMSK